VLPAVAASLLSLTPLGQSLRHALRWTAHHTGLPFAVVAAIALVVSFRLARKLGRLCVEVAVVSVVLLALTKLGWISW
jgi:hypothetical protein